TDRRFLPAGEAHIVFATRRGACARSTPRAFSSASRARSSIRGLLRIDAPILRPVRARIHVARPRGGRDVDAAVVPREIDPERLEIASERDEVRGRDVVLAARLADGRELWG